MPFKARKRPVVVECLDFDGTGRAVDDAKKWLGKSFLHCEYNRTMGKHYLGIHTKETKKGHFHLVSPGDIIIKGVEGEFYACKRSVFNKTYDVVKSE